MDSTTRFFISGFFSWISFPRAPEYPIRTVSNFFENSWRYLQLKVQRHQQWQNLPPVSLIPVVHWLANISANFQKNLIKLFDPFQELGGRWFMKKTWNKKSRIHCLLKLRYVVSYHGSKGRHLVAQTLFFPDRRQLDDDRNFKNYVMMSLVHKNMFDYTCFQNMQFWSRLRTISLISKLLKNQKLTTF